MALKPGGAAPFRRWVELALLLTVFAAGSGLGMATLLSHRNPDGGSSIACPTTFFARPLMIACGRGSFHPDIDAVPGLLPFLERRAGTFDPATLPKDIPVSEDSAAEYHLYLGWVASVLWRVFGISWRVLEPFLAVVLGLCAVCAYGLFRLGMNRWLSLAGTALFVTSPAVLDQVNNLRDFSKAPFLLGGIFALGWLATRREAIRRPWLVFSLMGLLAGVGMGFRQDAIILVPASLAVILFLSPGAAYGTRLRRAGAALMYLLAFVSAAAPMLTRMEGGAQPYHPLAQGYSMKHLDRCSLVPGACEPLACSHDNFVFATIFAHARRATGNDQLYFEYNSPEDARFTRAWVLRTALQFPADTIARGYGAILNLLAGADAQEAGLSYHDGLSARLTQGHRPLTAFFRVAGPVIALLALLSAAASGVRSGLTLLLLTLYFCGYVSLDNEWRHTFHLSLVSFWAAGFLLQQAISALRCSLHGTAQWGPWLRRAGVFFVLVLLVLWAPWQVARAWQQRTLEEVVRQYAEAPRSPVPTRAVPMRDWTLFRITHGPSLLALTRLPILEGLFPGGPATPFWETKCRLYAVRFRARPAGGVFMAKYWSRHATDDFSQLMRVAGADGDGGETWYFFPAYELADRAFLEGVALPAESAGDFLGLYRLEDSAQPSLLPCLTLGDPKGALPLAARIEQPYNPLRLLTPENEWVSLESASVKAEALGRMDAAVMYARAANALNPSSEQESRIAVLHEKSGQTQEALRLLEAAVRNSGGDFVSCTALDGFLRRNAAKVAASAVWEELSRQTPSPPVWQAYEQSLDKTEAEQRISVLRQLRLAAPDDLGAAARLQGLLVEKAAHLEAAGDLAGATAGYAEAIPLNPKNNDPVLRLDKLLSKGSQADRRSVWESLWKDNGDNPHVAVLCGTARAAMADLSGAREAFDAAHRLAPEEWYYYVLAADALAAAGGWDAAAAAYERALALNPGLEYLRGRLAEARKRATEAPAPTAEPGTLPSAP